MDGLPPLPKSLSGFLSFGKESLTRAEATLGLTTNNVKKNTQAPPFHNGAFSRDLFLQKINSPLIFKIQSKKLKEMSSKVDVFSVSFGLNFEDEGAIRH